MPPLGIHVWYGHHQVFGRHGHPQRWVNVLGDVSGGEGGVASLSYSLNGVPGSLPLSLGPDSRRLLAPGDFNVDLDRASLVDGLNEVVITAIDGAGSRATKIVTVEYTGGTTWRLPYAVDWGSVSHVQDAVQVVDGLWRLEGSGVRPAAVGYDRAVVIGDLAWADYEVTARITVHATDSGAFNPISTAPGMGIVMRWGGHTDSPVVVPQPHSGWLPSGAFGWYDWGMDGGTLYLAHGDGALVDRDSTGFRLAFGVPYVWRMRVETVRDQGYLYRLRVWPDTDPEPVEWTLAGTYGLDTPAHGSFLFVAHHVDAILGNVTVVPLTAKGQGRA